MGSNLLGCEKKKGVKTKEELMGGRLKKKLGGKRDFDGM